MSIDNGMNNKEGFNLMGAKVPIKLEGEKSSLSSSAQKGSSHENSILDRNDNDGLDLMRGFPRIKPEGKISFPSRSAQI